MNGKSVLEKAGLTARDVIVIILIMADIYLVSTGHGALDGKITQIEAQQVSQCQAVAR